MCRNIKLLFNFAPPATEAEIQASALQYVRKVSGQQKPSAANKVPFERAVAEIADITRRLLLEELATSAPARDRDTERLRAVQRGREREARILAKAR